MKLTAKQAKRVQKIWPSEVRPLAQSFLPPGWSQQIIYAVTVKQHPDKVKIGMTTNSNPRAGSLRGHFL